MSGAPVGISWVVIVGVMRLTVLAAGVGMQLASAWMLPEYEALVVLV